MPSHHTSIGANSLERKECYDIVTTDEEWYILVKVYSGCGKYIGFGLRIETGAERTTIVGIFDIIQQVVCFVFVFCFHALVGAS